jgi:ABC-type uncharacterized transport system substrate-binding protein
LALGERLRRREFIALVSGATAAWPRCALAKRLPVVGFLHSGSPNYYPSAIKAFQAGLGQSGFVEGQNVTIIYRWAEGHAARAPLLAAELVRQRVDVIAALGGGFAAHAAKAATSTIPIVFDSADDPVKAGLVASLNRPGGNMTGVGRLSEDLMPKRLELLQEAAGITGQITYLVDVNSAVVGSPAGQAAARTLGLDLREVRFSTGQDLDGVFDGLVRDGARALVIGPSSYFNARSRELGELCARHKLPAIYQRREFVVGGGLMSYGPSLQDAYRIAGSYTGRILKGENPANLPVQLQTRVELILNLKTAAALGLTIPLPLLGRADQVIE